MSDAEYLMYMGGVIVYLYLAYLISDSLAEKFHYQGNLGDWMFYWWFFFAALIPILYWLWN